MLETGMNCLCCGEKKFLYEFFNDYHVCGECISESQEIENKNQVNFALMYASNDVNIAKCSCNRFYTKVKRSKGGMKKVLQECEQCRSQATPMNMGESFTQEGGEPKTISNAKKKDSENTTEKTEKKSTLDPRKSTKETVRIDLNKENSGLSKIETSKTQHKGSTTMQTEKTNSEKSSTTEERSTQLSVSNQVLTHLKEENSASINCLNDSTERLMSYANQIANPKTDFEGQVVQHQTVDNMMNAVKCLEAARNNMKTKLEYMKFGNQLSVRLED